MLSLIMIFEFNWIVHACGIINCKQKYFKHKLKYTNLKFPRFFKINFYRILCVIEFTLKRANRIAEFFHPHANSIIPLILIESHSLDNANSFSFFSHS